MVLPMSSGQIAEIASRELGPQVSRDMVSYAILRTGVQPIGRAGRVRLFGPEAVTAIKQFLCEKRNPEPKREGPVVYVAEGGHQVEVMP